MLSDSSNKVGIVKSTYSDLQLSLPKLLNLCGGLKVERDKKIVIKINLCDFRPPETGAITHPVFLDRFLAYLSKKFQGLRIYVVESDATTARPDLFVKWFDFLSIINKWRAKWVNLSNQKKILKQINGCYFQTLAVPETFENSYFISLAKMKTHSLTKISCALKNQFGCIPVKRKIKFHPHLDDVIVDANLVMRPDFSIVDGIIGLGGAQGPIFGIPILANIMVGGKDPVAVDAVCARIMGFNPRFIGHIRKAASAGVGSTLYQTAGLEISDARQDFKFSLLDSYAMKVGQYIKNVVV